MSFLGSATHIISPVEDRGSGACKAGEAGCQDLTEGRDGGVTQESQTTREHRTCTGVPLSIHFHVGREGLPKMGSWSPFWQHKPFFPAAQLLLDPGGSQWRSLARRGRPSSPASPWMVPSHCCSRQPGVDPFKTQRAVQCRPLTTSRNNTQLLLPAQKNSEGVLCP